MLSDKHQLAEGKMARIALPIAALFMVIATVAQAHTGVGDTNGFVHGFAHPVSGIDHVLAMVAVGLFAAQLSGRALWLVPLAFVSMMALGGAFGIAGINPPFVEIGIGLSIVILGLAVAARWHMPTVAAMGLVGFFAVFHGHAHGAEMPETASGLSYGLGFMLATAALHVVGIGLGVGAEKTAEGVGQRTSQAVGGAMALAGIIILTGYL
jgi:urease accessory protein